MTTALRIWLVGGDRLASALASACDLVVLDPANWRERMQADRAPAFLLVEAADQVGEEWGDDLDRMLERCKEVAVSSLLWFADATPRSDWLSRCSHFRRVFSMDRSHLPTLELAGARAPSVLWPAASAVPASPEAVERTNSVLWLGGWDRRWPTSWRERLAAVLRGAADHDLHILASADPEGLPIDLVPRIASVESRWDRVTLLRDAKVVIGADPRIGSSTFAAPVIFDAIANGAAVITPHEFATIHDFGVGGMGQRTNNLLPVVHGSEDTARAIGGLLADDLLRAEIVSHLQRIVFNNHTHRHRLATLASAVDRRLTPDALDSAPT